MKQDNAAPRARAAPTRSTITRIGTSAVLLGLITTALSGCVLVPVPGYGYGHGHYGQGRHGYDRHGEYRYQG